MTEIMSETNVVDRQTDRHLIPIGTEELQELANTLNEKMLNRQGGQNQRLAIMLGMLTRDKDHPVQVNIPSRDRSQYSMKKYEFLLESPFSVSNKCCGVMKKAPAHAYFRETGRVPITAQMASESRLRTQKWIQNGYNAFDLKIPISNPMSFWTEQDVLLYIHMNKLPIASVYGEIVKDTEVAEQLDLADMGLFDQYIPVLKTTGCSRTGCVFCGFGCHLEPEGEGRFERLKITHPKIYDYIMRPWEDGGLNYKEVIDWMNENGNLHIRY